jgi:spore coat protein A
LLRQGPPVAAGLLGLPGLTGWRGCKGRSLETRVTSNGRAFDGGMCASSVAAPRPPLHVDALEKFVDPLPVPRVIMPAARSPEPTERGDLYRVSMRETEVRVHRDVPPTRMWGYAGEVPGPTFETRRGRPLSIEWVNELPLLHFLPVDRSLHGVHGAPEVRTVVHVHGARVAPESDGHPEDWYPPGASRLAHYPSQQDAATLWYHDHAMGIERLNSYAGLFGLFIVRDAVEDALRLPAPPYEIPLFLFDRSLSADGQLDYPVSGDVERPWVPEVFGDAWLVNGKLFPYLDVEPRRYRFRIINASNARFYILSLSGRRPMVQLGADQGLLQAPVAQTRLTLAPAERADVLVDFAAAGGETIVLLNGAAPLLQFRVAQGAPVRAPALPPRLRPVERIDERSARMTRTLTLDEYEEPKTQRMVMLLNATYWRQPVTETPELDSCEIWSFVNLTEDTHPIHLHLVRFQILDRQAFRPDEFRLRRELVWLGPRVRPQASESGWKDTVPAHPGMVTRIIMRFEGYVGRYVWHCHVLEHAANEMMRPYEIVAPARPPK